MYATIWYEFMKEAGSGISVEQAIFGTRECSWEYVFLFPTLKSLGGGKGPSGETKKQDAAKARLYEKYAS